MREHGLEKYVAVFAENEIELRDAPHLNDADLTQLGLPMGPRKRFVAAAAKLI